MTSYESTLAAAEEARWYRPCTECHERVHVSELEDDMCPACRGEES